MPYRRTTSPVASLKRVGAGNGAGGGGGHGKDDGVEARGGGGGGGSVDCQPPLTWLAGRNTTPDFLWVL